MLTAVSTSRATRTSRAKPGCVLRPHPGRPKHPGGLARYPLGDHAGRHARLRPALTACSPAGATVDRTSYQNSTLTDGEVTSNDDRNFNQYRRGGADLLRSGRRASNPSPRSRATAASRSAIDRSGFQRGFLGRLCKAR